MRIKNNFEKFASELRRAGRRKNPYPKIFPRHCKKRGQTNERTSERADGRKFRVGAKLGKFTSRKIPRAIAEGGWERGTRVRKLYFDSFYEVTDIR